ncbi:MAG: hypothetical protein WC539_07550 [Nitrospirota bacterium]
MQIFLSRLMMVVGVLFFTILGSGCLSAKGLHNFTSDGCSLFPDGTVEDRGLWCDCCFAHDISYWKGGTETERKEADRLLKECILLKTGNKVLARLIYNGVRVGGHPAFPAWYRWGYGWQYGRGYEPLTLQEQEQVQKKLAEYQTKHPFGYCKKGEKER